MIIVTGTKRSGTSMWMQILEAAGYPAVGEAFPAAFEPGMREANPAGFYESRFRTGINFTTNPDPTTGVYLHPADSRELAVKIFPPGLARTDLAFVDSVIAGMRDFREFDRSVRNLHRIEADAMLSRDGDRVPPVAYPVPYLEWWSHNHQLLVDWILRRYPLRIITHERVHADPAATIADVLAWVGGGDVDKAIAAVQPSLRRYERSVIDLPEEVAPRHAEVFDELYRRVHEGGELDVELIERMNTTHAELADAIAADSQRVETAREERRACLAALAVV